MKILTTKQKRRRLDNVLSSAEEIAHAVTALRKLYHAESTKRGINSATRLYEKISSKSTLQPWPLTIGSVVTFVAVLRASGYRSADAYLSGIMSQSLLLGYPPNPHLNEYLRFVRKAAVRNRGARERSEPLEIGDLGRLWDNAHTITDRRLIAACTIGFLFLLRIGELMKLRRAHVRLNTGTKTVEILIAQGKTDTEAVGVTRTMQCPGHTCTGPKLCPYHAAEYLLTNCPRVKPKSLLVGEPGPAGKRTDERRAKQFSREIRTALKRIGVPIKKRKSGRWNYTGHLMRRGGARALLRSGLHREVVRIWGRWRSEAVGAYLEEVAIEKATNILPKMIMGAAMKVNRHISDIECKETTAELQTAADALHKILFE